MNLLDKIEKNKAVVGVIGLGYVGLPLALEFALKGIKVIGFDVDEKKINMLEKGKSYIKHINGNKLTPAVKTGNFSATTDMSKLRNVDAIIICVPTPLDEHYEPDMKYVVNTANEIAKYMKRGQLISLESTTYPGTTDELLKPIFENSPKVQNNDPNKHPHKLKAGRDFYLVFSPEREDPNNPDFSTTTIPKVIGGTTPNCLEVGKALYDKVIVQTVPVASTKIAESTKLLENIYRSVNIALVNEMKIIFGKMGIDVWDVIKAASSKPFGYQPFYPGPGLGGHCIPIDPFYLSWKSKEFDLNTRFIELAGEINTYQPYYVVENVVEVLNRNHKSINGAKILILGVAYKKDIDDVRESPALKLMKILTEKGAVVDYNDPYIKKLGKTRKYKYNKKSIDISNGALKNYDLVLLSTDHTNYNYRMISEKSNLIIDTRNVFAEKNIIGEHIFKS